MSATFHGAPLGMAGCLLRFLLLASVTAASRQTCSSKRDCNYNGNCLSGSCVCFAAFKGEKCNVMNFVRPSSQAKVGLASIDSEGLQISSWGGSVLQHEDGTWHMWASEMTNGTGIKSWITNSQVVHAVASGPLGPWKRQEVVWPVFAHEPTVARSPAGEYVMFFTGGGPAYGQQAIPCTGKSCFGHNGTSDPSCPNDQQCTLSEPLLTRMSFSSSPYGPWQEPVLVPSLSNTDTNLAHVIFENGSMFGLGRPGHYWSSPDWRNVSQYTIGDTEGDLVGEDPMVWRDEFEESVLHAVLHGGGWSDPFGFHYFSEDGGRTWHGDNSVKTYENIVELTDTAALNLSRRERPHIILGGRSGKTPVALSNGVTEAWPCELLSAPAPGSNGTLILCPVDYCYTMVQGLATEEYILV
eukprot:TRINITY_DN91865_c0_g1_i1.p1 TRINITY_DN91865_c0_g1~~TRINITY_DN91865_c0_g1_i1.p1  ORF type:complete len:411 (+),score=60.13 TRINITY_DN91865_c0_g1_i1:20-1252(+)